MDEPQRIDLNQRLLLSARRGLINEVNKAIANGADVNAVDIRSNNSLKWTSLHFASNKGHLEIVKLLLKSKANPNIIDQRGHSAIAYADMKKHPELFQVLFKATDINLSLLSCQTIEIAKTCLDSGADINSRNSSNGRTALYNAVLSRNIELVQYLLQYNADPNIADNDDITPLTYLYMKNYLYYEFIQLLKDAGATLNYDVLLLISVKEEKLDEIKEALDNGANVDTQDKHGQTPLFIAILQSNKSIIQLLLEYKADPNVTDKNGINSFRLAIQLRQDDDDIVQSMVNAGGKDFEAIENDMSLLKAVHNGSIEEVEAALSNGADVNACEFSVYMNKYYRKCSLIINPALNIAIKECSIEMVQLLIEKNADVNMGNEPGLLIAILYNKYEAAKALIDTGRVDFSKTSFDGKVYLDEVVALQEEFIRKCGERDHNKMNKIAIANGYMEYIKQRTTGRIHNFEGMTYLHVAAYKGNFDIAQLIAKRGNIPPDIKDEINGQTPLHFAVQYTNRNSIDFIKHYAEYFNVSLNSKDNNGDTLLHHSCHENHVKAIEYLLSIAIVNPVPVNFDGKLPLDTIRFSDATDHLEVFDSFAAYPNSHVDYMVTPYQKVFMCGDRSAGKSTLTQVILYGPSEDPTAVVENVIPQTAGMNCHFKHHPEQSFIIYDMAGHSEYYSSHAAVLENLLRSPALFILVSKMYSCVDCDTSAMKNSLYYWLDFIVNISSHLSSPSHVIVIGSHYDEVSEEDTEQIRVLVDSIASDVLSNEMYKGFVPVVCNRPGGKGVRTFLKKLMASNEVLLDPSRKMSYHCHALNVYLKTLKGVVAISLDDLSSRISSLDKLCLTSDVSALKRQLTTLCDKGLLLFLSNDQSTTSSWIILDQTIILKEVNGVLFNQSIDRVRKSPVSDTGLLSVASLSVLFPQYNTDMLIGFLETLEFCYKIDSDTLKNTNVSLDTSENKKFLFFPSLVTIDRPQSIKPSADKSIGWCLWCTNPHQFLTMRYLQVLLFQLPIKYCLPRLQSPGKFMRDQTHHQERTEYHCQVWNNGIHWKRNSMESLVEVTEHNSCVKIIISGPDEVSRLKQCSSLIRDVTSIKDRLCSCKVNEYIILPADVPHALAKNISQLVVFDVRAITSAMLFREKVNGLNGEVELQNIISESEPYAHIAPLVIRELFNETKADCPVTANALCHLNESCSEVMSTYLPLGSSTHQSVKEHLNQFSILAGRDPLTLAYPSLSETQLLSISSSVLKFHFSQQDSTEPDIHQLYNILCENDCSHKWEEIGIALKLPHGKIVSLRNSQLSDEMKLYNVLQLWMEQMSTPCTWENIINVIKGPIVNKISVANQISKFQRDYSNTGLSSFIAPLLSTPAAVNLSPTVHDESQYFSFVKVSVASIVLIVTVGLVIGIYLKKRTR